MAAVADPTIATDVARLGVIMAAASGLQMLDSSTPLTLARIEEETGEDLSVFLPDAVLLSLLQIKSEQHTFDDLGSIAALRAPALLHSNPKMLDEYLKAAIASTNVVLLKELTKPGYFTPDAFDEQLYTVIMDSYSPQCVKLLLAAGANVNYVHPKWDLPMLHAAVCSGHAEYVRLVLEHGANPRVRRFTGKNVWFFAASKSVEIARVLVEYKAPVIQHEDDNSLLEHSDIQYEVLRIILQHNINVNYISPYRHETALFRAVRDALPQNVALLLEHGANTNVRNHYNKTPLHIAAYTCVQCAKLLLSHGAEIDALDDTQTTPLHVAANGHYEQTVLFVEHGANVNSATIGHHETPLYIAVQQQHAHIARYLIEHGATVDAATRQGWTPLFDAAASDVELTRLILDRGHDINHKTRKGRTPILHALGRNLDCFRLLIDRNANLDIVYDTTRSTLLHYAMRVHDSTQYTELLLEAGVDTTIKDTFGNTPLDEARKRHISEIVDLLTRYAQRRKKRRNMA